MANKSTASKITAILFAVALWQILAMMLHNGILLASPVETIKRLISLLGESDFYRAVGFSFLRITAGFSAAAAAGCMLAALSSRFSWIESLIWPFVTVIKATPVASFVILCLLWVGSKNLSVIISFLMVFPIIYTNVLNGIKSTDPKMIQMVGVFRLSAAKKLKYVYFPAVKSFLLSACSIAIGMAWKSGVAAEVIGIPGGSIGEKLYQAKVYLSSGDLLSWTIVIILLSVLFEKAFTGLIKLGYRVLEKR